MSGAPSGDNDQSVQFIEQAFVYNLPWAMEAVRVRAEAHEDLFSDEVKLSDYPRAHAVAALETGTLVVAAAILIQAGFGSRLAAIQAVTSTGANFDSMRGLMAWLASEEVQALSAAPNWPTPESHALWLDFHGPGGAQAVQAWAATEYTSPITWQGVPMPPGTPLRLGGGPWPAHRARAAPRPQPPRAAWLPEPTGANPNRPHWPLPTLPVQRLPGARPSCGQDLSPSQDYHSADLRGACAAPAALCPAPHPVSPTRLPLP